MQNPLRRWRRANDLTQSELARLLDVDRKSVGAWESGKIIPSTRNLLKIYNRTGIDVRTWQRFMEVK